MNDGVVSQGDDVISGRDGMGISDACHMSQGLRGFTLVELIVATTVASVLLLGVYGVFYQSLEVEGRTSTQWQRHGEATAIVDHIASVFQRAVIPEDGPAITASTADGVSVFELVTMAMPGELVMERVRYEWSADDETNGVAVVRRTIPYAGTVSLEPDNRSMQAENVGSALLWESVPARKIGTGIQELKISFRLAQDPGAGWQEQWSGGASEVVIRIRVQVGDLQIERVVRPAATGPVVPGDES